MERKARGRPRKEDPSTVLHAVTSAFWDRGLSGTSIDDLENAAGVRRPSLYGTFGGKREMYLRALGAFSEQLGENLKGLLGQSAKLENALANFFDASIAVYTSGQHGPRGCLLMCTASVEAVMDTEIRSLLRRVNSELDRAFLQRLDAAVASGELPPTDTTSRAFLLTALLHSIALRARAGETPDELKTSAKAGITAILGCAGKNGA